MSSQNTEAAMKLVDWSIRVSLVSALEQNKLPKLVERARKIGTVSDPESAKSANERVRRIFEAVAKLRRSKGVNHELFEQLLPLEQLVATVQSACQYAARGDEPRLAHIELSPLLCA